MRVQRSQRVSHPRWLTHLGRYGNVMRMNANDEVENWLTGSIELLMQELSSLGLHSDGYYRAFVQPTGLEVPEDLLGKIKDAEVIQSEDIVRLVVAGAASLQVQFHLQVGPKAFDDRVLNPERFEDAITAAQIIPGRLDIIREFIRSEEARGVAFEDIDLSSFYPED